MRPSSFDRRRLLQGAAAAAAAPLFLRHARASDIDRFALGVASGSPRPDRLVLWTRLVGPDLPARVPVQWELARDEAFTQVVARGTESAEAAWGHSVHAEPAGLSASRWYWYRFSALGARSAVGRTRTAPPAGASESLAFAIASCQRWDHGYFAAWRHLADEHPDLVVFLGDYIYEYAPVAGRVRLHEGSGDATTLAQYRARYAQYKGDADLQRIHAAAPWIATWDDHEVANDYANAQGQDLAPDFLQRRAAAYQAWWEHMPVPKATRPAGPNAQVFDRYDWGALARFHVLDDRQYRDAQACPKPGRGGSATVDIAACPELMKPGRTLLGTAQERWLDEGLAASGARWNLVAQQTLMAPFTWTQEGRVWTDGWAGYPAARERLLDTLAARKASNPVVLSGDVHCNYVADLKRAGDAAPLATEFCGTSITSHGMEQARLDAVLPLNPHIRYARSQERGYVSFRLSEARMDATLRVVSDANDPQATIRSAARFSVEAGRPEVQAG